MESPEFYAALTNRSILDQRFATSLNKQTTKILQDLSKWLRERISREGASIASKKRYQALLSDIEKHTAKIYKDITDLYVEQFKGLTYDEAAFVAQSMQSVVVSGIVVETVSNQRLWSAVVNNPLSVGGNNSFVDFDEMIKEIGENSKKVASVISGGYSQGMTLQEMTQRIIGTRAQGYSDGIIDKSRRDAQAIVRTSVTHIASSARNEIYKQNQNIIWGYTIVATLDTRTSATCRFFDGKTYRYGDSYNPMPPFHYNCRTQTIAEFDANALSRKGGTRAANFKEVGDLKGGKVGQIDAQKQYYEVLKRQPKSQQDAVLGKARGLIFRNSGLTAQEFREALTDRMGKPLTLSELAAENKKILDYMQSNSFLSGYLD